MEINPTRFQARKFLPPVSGLCNNGPLVKSVEHRPKWQVMHAEAGL
jgi:hypothetical protein